MLPRIFRRHQNARCRPATGGRPDELVVTPVAPGVVRIAPASGAWEPVLVSGLEVGKLRADLRTALLISHGERPDALDWATVDNVAC